MTPQQAPGRSKQDYQTPPELLRAIERDFHVEHWAMDLAADQHNHICPTWLGPGSAVAIDALKVDWVFPGDLWLNPPFADIEPWVKKCAFTVRFGRIFLLVPASVGSNWYQAYVHGRGHTVAISPRVSFTKDPYPKDITIVVFGPLRGGFSTWRWK
jgi:DNA (cytosine-5)-methyltransferase 1